MAYPSNFKGSNIKMVAPAGAENVVDIHAFTNGVTCVTCWELSAEEIADITLSGKVYLSVFMNGGMPPVAVGSEKEIRDIVADYGVWQK